MANRNDNQPPHQKPRVYLGTPAQTNTGPVLPGVAVAATQPVAAYPHHQQSDHKGDNQQFNTPTGTQNPDERQHPSVPAVSIPKSPGTGRRYAITRDGRNFSWTYYDESNTMLAKSDSTFATEAEARASINQVMSPNTPINLEGTPADIASAQAEADKQVAEQTDETGVLRDREGRPMPADPQGKLAAKTRVTATAKPAKAPAKAKRK